MSRFPLGLLPQRQHEKLRLEAESLVHPPFKGVTLGKSLCSPHLCYYGVNDRIHAIGLLENGMRAECIAWHTQETLHKCQLFDRHPVCLAVEHLTHTHTHTSLVN